jgi:8-oxo-dGTP diphosphatase
MSAKANKANSEKLETSHIPACNQFRITSRGIIVENEQILFVSDEGQYWYTPGGRLEPEEDLKACLEREVFEETGLIVKAGSLLYVQECMDIKVLSHKIHFYFQTTIQEGKISDHWLDAGGAVKYRQFFSMEDIRNNQNIIPRFLAELDWNDALNVQENLSQQLNQDKLVEPVRSGHSIYRGCITTRGFESLGHFLAPPAGNAHHDLKMREANQKV